MEYYTRYGKFEYSRTKRKCKKCKKVKEIQQDCEICDECIIDALIERMKDDKAMGSSTTSERGETERLQGDMA